MDLASTLVRNVINTNYEDLPSEVVNMAKKIILDTLGISIGGSMFSHCKMISDYVNEIGGKKESTVLVFGGKVPSPNAAFANAVLARAMNFDETHEKASVHAARTVVPVSLAIAESTRASGRDFITAVVLGSDLVYRMSFAPKLKSVISGFDYTCHCGTFGTALAAGKLLGLNENSMLDAIWIAFSQAAGIRQLNGEATIHSALSAKAGLLSAVLAKRGITGARGVLEGKYGYYPVFFHNKYDPELVTQNLGKTFEILNTSFKMYPTCNSTQRAIQATLEIVHENNIKPTEVKEIIVHLNKSYYQWTCEPLESKRRPKTQTESQRSIPFTIATAVVKRRLSLSDFIGEALDNKRVLEIAQKVKPKVDPNLDKESYVGGMSPVIVKIRTTDNGTYSRGIDFRKGHPRNPMSMDECIDKFSSCISHSVKALPEEKVREAIFALTNLERIDDVSKITKLLLV